MSGKILDQWRQLLINFSVNDTAVLSIYEDIALRYEADGRYYHNLSHIKQLLTTITELQPLAHDYPALQLAVWFHDIIYDTRKTDNERQSAAYAESVLTKLSIPPEIVAKVSQMILATANHLNPTNDPDANILLDADLAILGSDEKTFAAYCQAIRQEYAWVPESTYRPARIDILTRFLERPRIYRTPALYKRLETKARENLQREIGRLS